MLVYKVIRYQKGTLTHMPPYYAHKEDAIAAITMLTLASDTDTTYFTIPLSSDIFGPEMPDYV